jgi:O-antigen ligase
MRGLPGLILFLLFLTLPLYIFWRSRPFSRQAANMGIAWVIFFSIVSLTQSSVFSRGHYLSVYLGVLVILLASCRAGGQDNGTATNELEPRDVSAGK